MNKFGMSKGKAFTLMLLLFTISLGTKANPVDMQTAREVGAKFINANTRMNATSGEDLLLVATYTTSHGDAAFHVFNVSQGFIIVAADDCATPILGYSDEGRLFDPDNVPIQMQEYLQAFVEQIQYGIENHLDADEVTAQRWAMVMQDGRLSNDRSTTSVEPLLTTTWSQSCYYNALCPEDANGPCGHTYAGCVATAMAQIMNFWGYPHNGNGSHTYIPSNYPEQSVNFAATTYDWANMPNALTATSSQSEIEAVATLLYHCGVAVNMDYGPSSSAAYDNYVQPALTEYFNFADDLYWMYPGSSFLDSIKACLNRGCPIYYKGFNPPNPLYPGLQTTGHAWVCDGYDPNNLLHFNWGWGGSYDGYYDTPYPASGYNFTSNQGVILNIHPKCNPDEYFQITTNSYPSMGGTVTGVGSYQCSDYCTLTAVANEGYAFHYWTENDSIISRQATVSFPVMAARTLTAHFGVKFTVDTDPSGMGTISRKNVYPVYDDNSLYTRITDVYDIPLGGYVIMAARYDDMLNHYAVMWNHHGSTFFSSQTIGTDEVVSAETIEASYPEDWSPDSYDWDLAPLSDGKFVLINANGDTIYSTRTGSGLSYDVPTYYNWSTGTVFADYSSRSWTISNGVSGSNALVPNLEGFTFMNYNYIYQENRFIGSGYDMYGFHGFGCGQTDFNDPNGNSILDIFWRTYSESFAPYDSIVTLTAVPREGYSFQNWTRNGIVVSTEATISFTATETAAYVAHFIGNPIITVLRNPENGGEVGIDGLTAMTINHYTCNYGDVVSMTAIPNEDYTFTNWTKDGEWVSNEATYTFIAMENAEYVANFDAKPVVSVTMNPEGSGIITGTGSYPYGTTVILTATANEGYTFNNWTEDGIVVSTESSYSFMITEDVSLVANFATNPAITVAVEPEGWGTIALDGLNPMYDSTSHYTRITDLGELHNGDRVIIAARYNDNVNEYLALENILQGNYRQSWFNTTEFISQTVDGDEIIPNDFNNDESYYWTVGITDEGNYTFTNTEGNAIGINIRFSLLFGFGTRINWTVSSGVSDFDALVPEYEGFTLINVDASGFGFAIGSNDAFRCRATDLSYMTGSEAPNYNFYFDFFKLSYSHYTCDYGATVSLTAIPNPDYSFDNWTKDGQVVSTEATYTFTATEDAGFVANFVTSPTISVAVNPEEGGSFRIDSYDGLMQTEGLFQYARISDIETLADGDQIILAARYDQNDSHYAVLNNTLGTDNMIATTLCTSETNEGMEILPSAVTNNIENYLWTVSIANGQYTFTNAAGETIGYNNYMYFIMDGDKSTWTMSTGISDASAMVPNYSGFTITNATTTNRAFALYSDLKCGAYHTNYMTGSNAPSYNFYFDVFKPQSLEMTSYESTVRYGGSMTLTALANEGYSFINWTKTSEVVSEDETYSFTVTETAEYVANFVVSGYVTITATANPEGYGTVSGGGTYYTGTTCTLEATANEGYNFESWTRDGVVVSTNPIYSFKVSEEGEYVANFNSGITQVSDLAQGWNWWSTYIEQEGIDGLGMLEESLGSNGYQIKSQTDFVTNYGSMWMGMLSSINNEETYMIDNTADCQIELTGAPVSPVDHPITVSNGWNWIGYPCTNTMSVGEAFSGYTPANGDQVKSQSDYAMYFSGMWIGQLLSITPGTGLMYMSNNAAPTTLVYPDGNRNTAATASPKAMHWKNDIHAYPNNMTVMAVVELDDEELNTDNYELAAFDVNGECRGSVKLTYVEPINRYVAFLTVSGKEAAELNFGLYDSETGREYFNTEKTLVYVTNATIGNPEEPYVVRFRSTTGMNELASSVQVYPNPVNRGEHFSINVADEEKSPVRVEIVNALGMVVETVCTPSSVQTLTAPNAAGVYTLRITVEGKGTLIRKLVVK